jgi:hypothetical protein
LPDGSALLATATGDDNIDNFIRIPVDASPRLPISHPTATDAIFRAAVNPDGRVVFSRGTAENDVILLTLDR